jgi:catechol 2,3-dioxygenase-like lactoylglutathione lyase family enzyme
MPDDIDPRLEDVMPDPNFIILYVDNPPASAAFYSGLLRRPPVEQAPTFAMLELSKGVMLGLWAKDNVEPAAHAKGGGGEVAFTVNNKDAVRALHDEWRARKLPIAQEPTVMDFGYTFVALDPDGHRLRVFAPAVL